MHIECPSCGSQNEISPSHRYINCPYCDSALHIELGESLGKTTFKITTQTAVIPGLIKKTLLNHGMIDTFDIMNIHLIYFPPQFGQKLLSGVTGFPQFKQVFEFSSIFLPHFEQNFDPG